jgi:hypothetical protein
MSSLNRQCQLLKLTCAQSSDHELVNTVEYDFSDASNDKLDSKALIKMIDCKNATYTSDKERNGQPSYKPITPSQLAEMDAAGSHPCNCEICPARARNGMEMKLATRLFLICKSSRFIWPALVLALGSLRHPYPTVKREPDLINALILVPLC